MKELDSLLEMSNEEAANIIQNMLNNARWPRGNGKSMMSFRRAAALLKAIDVLRRTPD
jgi:hypothetical protein